MARIQTDETRTALKGRSFASRAVLMFVFVATLIVAMLLGVRSISTQVENNQAEFLTDAVRRSAVQCYVLEGRFPSSVEYLEEHYGLIVDRNRYAVYYEPMGSNILPQIRVVMIHT
ncbi:MAG: hypothetical protein LBB42_01145 [Coriobacteriales bacterium]|jgi:hypothetical protein|nr:hypothetical protein [Coriobacteriales bacterium]